MNILFIVMGIGYGGSSKQLAYTANSLSEKGHKVFVHSLNVVNCYQRLNKDVTYIPPQSKIKKRQLQWFTYPFIIRQIAHKNGIDIIISWRTNAGSYSVLATVGTKIRTIFSERSDPYMEPSSIHAITTFLASLSDGGVFQTSKARDYYKRLAPKSVVIPNPIDPNIKLPEIVDYSSRPKEIVYVGRMSIHQKRQDILLKVMEHIHNQLPDYRLRMYGDGKDMEKLKVMTKEKGLEDVVIFEGAVNNVVDRIKNARLMLLTSDYEGIPNVILEAFQAGVPVVSTDCSPGGCRVLIDDGINGYITPFRNDEITAQKAMDLLLNEKLAQNFIYNSRKKLLAFSPEKIFSQWDKYINTICKNK